MSASLLSRDEFVERLNAIAEIRLADHQYGVSALAREMEISRSSLHRKVKESFHTSASKYISHKRLNRARHILLDNKITIKEIAFQCGFHSVTYFDKCFHDYFGFTPNEIRKQLQARNAFKFSK